MPAKRGPSLFEVIETSRAGKIPTEKQPETPAEVASATPAEREAIPSRSDARNQHRAAPEIDRGSSDEATTAGALSISGDKIHVALSTWWAAVVLFAIVLSVVTAFSIGRGIGFDSGFAEGRASYQAQVSGDIESARQATPDYSVVESVLTDEGREAVETRDDAVPQAESSTWVPGYSYIVVQTFRPENASDAGGVQQFLSENGVGTALVRFSSGSTILVTTRGYNASIPKQREQRDDYLARIVQLGKLYSAQGGQYDWKDAYVKTLTGESWNGEIVNVTR